MAVTGDLELLLDFVATQGGDYEGGVRVPSSIGSDVRFASGTGTNQADKLLYDAVSIAGSATDNHDLQTDTDAFGVALSLAEVRNGGALNIKPNAANGWTSLLADASDIIHLEAGCTFVYISPGNGALAVSGTVKAWDVVNTVGTACTYEILIIGASA